MRGVLHEALLWADELGQRSGVSLILDSGTLLGAVRDGAMLSGDLDLDLSVAGDSGRALLSAAASAPCTSWRYDRRIYKISVDPAPSGPPVTADIKLFRRAAGFWQCPAVGARQGQGGGAVRKALTPLWRRFKRSDAARAPLRWFACVDQWAVPASYFDDLVPVAGLSHCLVPRELDGYLSYRYGDWRTPRHDWVSWRDDGAFRRSS